MKPKVFLTMLFFSLLLSVSSPVNAAEDGSGTLPGPEAAAEGTNTETGDLETPEPVFPETVELTLSPEQVEYIETVISKQTGMLKELTEINEVLADNLRAAVSLLLVLAGFEIMRILKAWTSAVRGGK